MKYSLLLDMSGVMMQQPSPSSMEICEDEINGFREDNSRDDESLKRLSNS